MIYLILVILGVLQILNLILVAFVGVTVSRLIEDRKIEEPKANESNLQDV